jgi:hypothetical protein
MLSRMMSDYTVETINDGLNEFNVEFHGPKESTTPYSCFYVLIMCCTSAIVLMDMISLSLSLPPPLLVGA